MKRSKLLAVAVVALMLTVAIPAQVASAQTAYTEKLTVYTAGSMFLWEMTFTGINGSSHLSAFESTPGLSWYNISAISTTSWVSDMQIFGPSGYNLLPVPFVPSQGLFLSVGSDSYADALSAANALDSYLVTSFTSLSNGTGTYSFYSPISFSSLIPLTLFKFLPSSEGGFAKVLGGSFFMGTDSPFIVLEGAKGSSGFTHSMVIGSMGTPALNGESQVSLTAYFSSTISKLQASNHSSSSVIQLNFLDGMVTSHDKGAVVTNNPKGFTGSYTLSLTSGESIGSINASVVELPAPLVATREVDTGVLRTGDDLAVTLSFKNLSPTDIISEINFTDNWWNSTGDFTFLGGNYTAPSSGLVVGASVTPVYRLQYTGTGTGTLMIPASVVHYEYVVGGLKVFNGTAILNPIRLSLGADEAVVYTTVTPEGTVDPPVGTPQKFNVTVTNVGTLPASSVVVAGQSVPGLAAKSGSSPGGSATITVTKSALGLVGVNATQSFITTYQDPSGNTLTSTSNVVPVAFSHISMVLGFPSLTVGVQLSTRSNLETSLNFTFTTSNNGFANMTSFVATGALPAGLGCGKVNGTGISCSDGLVTISYPSLVKTAVNVTTMSYNLTSPTNLLMAPMRYQGMSPGFNESGVTNPVAIPAGLVLSKEFVPALLFGGMSSTVEVSAINRGPLPLYNATVGSSVDNFDTLSSTAIIAKGPSSIAAGANTSLSYGVTTSQAFGNLTATPAIAKFFFGGTQFSLSGFAPTVEVYQPLSVTISTTPTTPEEGKNFNMTFQITNPTGVAVSDVLFTLPIPSGVGLSNLKGLTYSSGVLTISLGSLAADGTDTATATAVASSGITIPFAKGVLTFTYSGTSINGTVPIGSGIAIAEDVTTRYLIPMAFVFLVLILTAYYVRRKAAPTVPASPK